MKYVANILTNEKFSGEIYNIVNKFNDLIEGIPTLVIGWDFCKKNYPNSDILDNKIDNLTYWTYGKREKRDKYEESVEWFKNFAIKKFIESIKYEFINVMLMSGGKKDKFYSLFDGKIPNSYFVGDMCYINNENENVVYGVSLRDFSYIGVDSKKIARFIYKNSNVINSNDKILQENKQYFVNCKYTIPYLLS